MKTSGIGSLVSWCGICFMARPSLEYSLEDWPDFSQILCQRLWYVSHSCEKKIWVIDSHYWFHMYCVPNSFRLFILINVLNYKYIRYHNYYYFTENERGVKQHTHGLTASNCRIYNLIQVILLEKSCSAISNRAGTE